MTDAPAGPPPGLGLARGESALVTGASTGIGAAFARALAARGVDLLLTARPGEERALERLAGELAGRHAVRCDTVAVDLTARDGAERLRAAAAELGFEPGLLVNNAGVMAVGAFASGAPDAWLPVVHVNVEAVVALSRLFAAPMAARGAGAIVTVASTAAFEPQPHFAVYAASKAFALAWGEALWAELRPWGVRAVTVCVGPVETRPESGDAAAPGAGGFLRRRFLAPDEVARRALEAVAADRPVVVLRIRGLGRLHGILALARSALPRRRRLLLAERVNRALYGSEVKRSDTDHSAAAAAGSRLAGDDSAGSRPAK